MIVLLVSYPAKGLETPTASDAEKRGQTSAKVVRSVNVRK